jgi:hypothetical protein
VRAVRRRRGRGDADPAAGRGPYFKLESGSTSTATSPCWASGCDGTGWRPEAGDRSNHRRFLGNDASSYSLQTTDYRLRRNNTGFALPRFAVLALSEPIIGPAANLQEFKNKVNFEGGTPYEPTPPGGSRYCSNRSTLTPSAGVSSPA